MTLSQEQQQKKDAEFVEFVEVLKNYLKQNPNHKGAIAKTSAMGQKMYRFAGIRQGKLTSTVYNEKHFAVLDKILPEWDCYSQNRFDFDLFKKQLQKFVDQKNKFYDSLGVPEELRDLHVPEKQKLGDYYLGSKVSRMKLDLINITPKQKEEIEQICPDCFKTPLRFSVATFYVNLKKFVAAKDAEYEALNVPKELRDYRVHYNDVVGDYPIGSRRRYFLSNWDNLNEQQQQCFLKIAPNFFEEKTKGFNFASFFVRYASFIDKKNKYYDKLETPQELRSYSLSRHEEVDGYPLGEKLYYIKKQYKLNPKEISALDKLNPKWRDNSTKFDFGEFYGQFVQFRKVRDNYFNKNNVPQEKRAYTVFSSSYMGHYPLGLNFYLIRCGKLKISNKEKEYLLNLDPNCLKLLSSQKKGKNQTELVR